MKVYQFYSDYNDKDDYKRIPQKIRDAARENIPIPEEWRSKERDIIITGLEELLPPGFKQYDLVHIWYSKHNTKWRMSFYSSKDINKTKIIMDRHKNTLEEITYWPEWCPKTFFKMMIKLMFESGSYHGGYRKIFDEHGATFYSIE